MGLQFHAADTLGMRFSPTRGSMASPARMEDFLPKVSSRTGHHPRR
jgi:hypothetical protein